MILKGLSILGVGLARLLGAFTALLEAFVRVVADHPATNGPERVPFLPWSVASSDETSSTEDRVQRPCGLFDQRSPFIHVPLGPGPVDRILPLPGTNRYEHVPR
jgi:hypothetical protein